MDVGSITICMTIGTLICLIFFGMGVCIGNGRSNKGQPVSDSDVRLYIYSRYRNRGSDKRVRKPNYEEKLIVLETIEVGCTEYERTVLRAIHKDIEELQRGEDDGR